MKLWHACHIHLQQHGRPSAWQHFCKTFRGACRTHNLAASRYCQADSVVLPGMQALRALGCMEHRGACSADNDSGDGAGLMTQIPWKLLKKDLPAINEATTG